MGRPIEVQLYLVFEGSA